MAESKSNRESSLGQEEGVLVERDTQAIHLVAEIQTLKQAAKTKEDYQVLTKLYQQLEKLYTGEKEKKEELEFSLHEQYRKQVEILLNTGLIKNLESGEYGIAGIDGKEYPVPTESEIAELIEQNKELVEQKKEQGFTKLLLVPFGTLLGKLAESYKQTILKHHKEGKLFGTKKDPNDPNEKLQPLELDKSQPLYVWDKYNGADLSRDADQGIVYYPEQFDKNHKGKNKFNILDEQGGWNIILIEDMPNIPRKDPEVKGGRTQIDTQGSSIKKYIKQGQTVPSIREYKKALQEESMYKGESGMTPEDQLMHAITHLEETNQVIDDYRGNGSVSYQIEAYFPASGDVPYACWRRGDHQAFMSGFNPEDRDGSCGVRSAVRLRKA